MIRITDKQRCCGCHACVQRCPKACITLIPDAEGFSYPQVDLSRCIDCGLCEKVCPVIHPAEAHRPQQIFAANNTDPTIRLKSASGGIFTSLAEHILLQNGVVFGARFNDAWEVVHDYTETHEGLASFRCIKYVQSSIGECYRQAENFLKSGRTILFTGTPCQLSGLRCYLGKSYTNLLAVEIVCHGVPSPGIWQDYLHDLCGNKRPDYVHFRYKPESENLQKDLKSGMLSPFAKKSHVQQYLHIAHGSQILCAEPHKSNPYIRGFLSDLFLRPSCHACPARSGRSGSDITIADFWGIKKYHRKFYDHHGISLIMIHTPKGLAAWQQLSLLSIPATYEQALAGNPSSEQNAPIISQRAIFWQR